LGFTLTLALTLALTLTLTLTLTRWPCVRSGHPKDLAAGS